MALNISTFLTRTGSAIVFAIIMMIGLLWNAGAFTTLLAVIQFFCLREFFLLQAKIHPNVYYPGWLQTLTQIFSFLLLILFSFFLFSKTLYPGHYWAFLLFLPILILLVSGLSEKSSLEAAFQACGGLMYITVSLVLMLGLRSISMILPIALILMIWTNDTMAYIVGSFIGKTPFSKISPKKTWEGTVGGIILTIVGAAIWGYFSRYYQMLDWIILALIAGIAGTAGDLLESRLKRLADVKDSGAIMPGHGGALDRFDSLLVATPFAFAYAYLFMPTLSLVIF